MMEQFKSAHTAYMTPKQLQQFRFILFAKAAQSMGTRIDELKAAGKADDAAEIQAIRSEWVLDDE